MRQALDLGINFFDTANVYSGGDSEAVLGRFLKANARREAVVIATKVHGVMREEPNGRGLSRKAILFELDQSLTRLQTDYVDLYQIHRWDYETPIEETLEALHDVVKAGKVRYIGASSMYAWQFAKALYLADLHGWTRFVSMQNHYNLLYREEEREMMGLCQAEGIGVIPWSPLARGRLDARMAMRDHEALGDGSIRQRACTRKQKRPTVRVVDRLGEIAERRGVPRAQVALAWLLSKPGSRRPSSARPSRIISRTLWPRSPSACRRKRLLRWKSRTCRIRCWGSANAGAVECLRGGSYSSLPALISLETLELVFRRRSGFLPGNRGYR